MTRDSGDGEQDQLGRILFVCRANVCRSPVMEFVFSAAVGDDAEVTSAGTKAPVSHPLCEVSAERLASRDGAPEFTQSHRSREIDASMLEKQSLVLAASGLERSALAHLSPRTRARVFTAREAYHLAEAPVSPADRHWLAGTDAVDRWGMFAALLDRRRGTVALGGAQQARGWGLLRTRNTLDVEDTHHKHHRAHSAAIASLVGFTDRLSRRVLDRLDELAEADAQRPSAR